MDQELSTGELINRLKQMELENKTRAKERHELNNSIQVALLSLTNSQQLSQDNLKTVTEVLADIGKKVSVLHGTVFGPNGDNGLRGKVANLEHSHNEFMTEFRREIQSVWIKFAIVSTTLSGIGIATGKLFFQ
jgi:hypothetical protein